MNHYDVHVEAVVRVKIANVQAESQEAAITRALKSTNFHELFFRSPDKPNPSCEWVDTEFNEDFTGYTVDEANDPEHERSQFWEDRTHLQYHERDEGKFPTYPSQA